MGDKTLCVIARKGATCPKEIFRHGAIGDVEPVTVPNSGYYRRLIADGSLVRVSPKQVARSRAATAAPAPKPKDNVKRTPNKGEDK